jgi:hypothetical protein
MRNSAALVLLAVCGVLEAAPTMDGPYLVDDLPAARAEAKRTGKPIFLVFRCER